MAHAGGLCTSACSTYRLCVAVTNFVAGVCVVGKWFRGAEKEVAAVIPPQPAIVARAPEKAPECVFCLAPHSYLSRR